MGAKIAMRAVATAIARGFAFRFAHYCRNDYAYNERGATEY
jgi:hypothetical protein